MGTIIITTVLGLFGLVLDILKLRKVLVPFTVVALLLLVGYNTVYWDTNASYFSNMLFIDNFAVAFSGLIVLIGALVIGMSSYFYKDEADKISDYVSLMLFAISGAIMMVSYGNMATLFLGLEIMSVSLYILAASRRNDLNSNEAGMKYFLMGAFSTGFLLFGITLIYGVTGTFDLEQIAYKLNHQSPTPVLMVGFALLTAAMMFKASVAPFHFWAPDVYTGSPALVTAFMSTVAKVASFAALYKLLVYGFGLQAGILAPILIVFIVLTLLISNFSALAQNSLKRILAYSGISHAGFMLLAIISTTLAGPGVLFYYALAYALAGIAAFSVVVYVSQTRGDDLVDTFTGLAYEKPSLAVGMVLAMLSMAGIPPFAGFFGKYLVFVAAISVGYVWLAVVGVVVSIVSVYYYFRVVWAMFKKPAKPVGFAEVPFVYTAVLWLSVLALIALGVLPGFFSGLLS